MGRALGGDQVQSRMKSVSAPRRKLTVAGVQPRGLRELRGLQSI